MQSTHVLTFGRLITQISFMRTSRRPVNSDTYGDWRLDVADLLI